MLERQLGIERWACPLPGHTGLAMVDRWDGNGSLQYGCDCLGSVCEMRCPRCGEVRSPYDYSPNCHQPPFWFRPLGEAYHALWTGRELALHDKLPRGLRFAWLLLLEHDAGQREPVALDLPVPPDATDLQREAAGLAALMFGLERGEGVTSPMPFSVTLVVDRLRVPRPRAGEAIRALREAGTIVKVDSIRGQGRRTFLYQPGDPIDR